MTKFFTACFTGLCAALLTLSCSSESPPETLEQAEVTVQVSSTPLHLAHLNDTVVGYGTVQALPEQLQILSVPYNSEIDRVYVSDGQMISAGMPLLTLKAAVDARLQIAQAREELNAALQEEKLLQQRVQLHLATQTEQVTAQLRVAQARVLVNNLTERGASDRQTLNALQTGIVQTVTATTGQHITAGNALLQWFAPSAVAVRLGIDANEVARLHPKQAVQLQVNHPPYQLTGQVQRISQQIDAATRLLTVWVIPNNPEQLLLNEFVQAAIIVDSVSTLVAPRSAVLPDGAGYSLFTLHNDHAVKHQVTTGLIQDGLIAVQGDNLKAGDAVVSQGNYELQDGSTVKVQQP
jgi:RND family efflux transporter MFP subunit